MLLLRILSGFGCMLICTSIVQSQYIFNDISLDSFSLPNIVRNTLDFRGTLSGFHSQTNTHVLGIDRKESIFRPIVDASFQRYVNSLAKQSTSGISLRNNFTLSDMEVGSLSSDAVTRFDHRISFSNTQRLYKGNSFVLKGISAISTFSFEEIRSTENGIYDQEKSIELANSLTVSYGFGHGRIELVSDLVMAMFLLQDAVDLGLNENYINESDLFDFAALMAQVRHDRILDSRRQRIHELRQLYQFMLDKGWVISDDPGYFTVLTDNWLFNDIFFRNAGKRWSFTGSPSVAYLRHEGAQELQPGFHIEFFDLSASVSASFDKYKQVSLHQDNSRHHLFALSANQILENGLGQAPHAAYVQFNTQHGLRKSWYPNSRSSLRLSAHGNYNYYIWLNPSTIFREDQHTFVANLFGDFDYFISYRTRVSLRAEAGYGINSGGRIANFIVDNIYTNIESSGFYGRLNGSILVSIF